MADTLDRTSTATDVTAQVTAWLEESWDPDLTVGEWWQRLGLSGWVTNLPSGEVEVRASGEDGSVERLRRALEVGPTGASVQLVHDVQDGVPSSLPYPFAIHR